MNYIIIIVCDNLFATVKIIVFCYSLHAQAYNMLQHSYLSFFAPHLLMKFSVFISSDPIHNIPLHI